MTIEIILVLVFGSFCFGAGILVGSRNHARIQADLDDAKSDISAIKDKLAILRAPLPRPAATIQPTAPTTSAPQATSSSKS